ncbi:MAG: hypothetical protein IJS67_04015, partial [Clostridia bacterium]|nr:hypothetical protein [Clostridia bacterium]
MIEKAAEKQGGYSVKNALKSLFTLTVMQLKEKTELGFSGNFVKSLFKVVYFVLEFALVTAVCFVLFYFCRLLGVFSLISDVPVSVVSIVFLLMLTLSVAFGTATLVKSLYLSKDNFVLLTFPAKPYIVFLSKIAVNYICELRKNFLFLIPFFTGYGIAEGFAIYYYPWLFVLFAFISLLPVLISALLSIPALFIYRIVKKFKILQALLIVLAAAAVLWVGFTLIGFIPENIDLVATWGTTYWKIQDFLDAFVAAFPITYAFTQLIVGTRAGLTVYLFTGTTALHFAVLLGTLVLLVVLCLLLS